MTDIQRDDRAEQAQDEETTLEVEQFWEGHYRARPQVWSGRANAVLVDVVTGMGPGRALDVGCGEGGDAIWLAGRGWQVTAVDVSATALERAVAAAEGAGLADRIDFQRHDLGVSFPAGRFDLVSAQFLQSPVHLPRGRVLRTAADAVAPGGLLLIVEHASFPPWSSHHHDVEFPTPAETLATLELDLSEWRVERLDTPEREASGPDGQHAALLDNVVALTRLAV